MGVEIRSIEPGEVIDWLRAQDVPWGERSTDDELRLYAEAVEPARALVAVDGGRFVGFAAIISSAIGLPGGRRAGAAAVTAVGVYPTHRRRGILRSMMERQLHGLREGGEPCAILGASESVIYRRFGYGVASYADRFDIETAHAAFRRPLEPRGRMEMVDWETFLRSAPQVYRRVCSDSGGIAGTIDRPMGYWRAHTGDPKGEDEPFGPRRYALHRDDAGVVDGYVMYRPRVRWEDNDLAAYELRLEELCGPPDVEPQLWFFVLHHDLVRSVSGYRRPPDDALGHLLRDPRRLRRTPIDDLWVRPLDVVALLEARRYPASGRLVLAVADEFCPWVAGTYELDGGPEGAACRRTTASPDLAIDAAGLGSILLGGVSPTALLRAGLLEEHASGAAARAAAMFSWHRAPWNLGEF